MITNLERVKICTDISNTLLACPEAITDYICVVGDEVSLIELVRIRKRFLEKVRNIKQKGNINN